LVLEQRISDQGVGKGSGSTKPNIILILVDDMGFSDIGCYGSEIRTPNLDRLAEGGARFRQMYTYPRCCPSRACMLTGLYPHQVGVGHMVDDDRGMPGYRGYLNNQCVTIAEALRPAGYRTYMSGKWHVGGPYYADNPEGWNPGAVGFPTPVTRGFDCHYGTLSGAGSYFRPHALVQNDKFIEPEEEYYYTDAIGDRAMSMIDDAARRKQPFFLHIAYTSPHWPLHALPEDIAKYEGTYRRGWDVLRQRRYEGLVESGTMDGYWPLSPRDPRAPEWTELPTELQVWEDQRMAVYAAQIDRMDQGVGRVIAKLESLRMLDNTLIMFLTDNGGCAEVLREGMRTRFFYPEYRGGRVVAGNRPGLRPGPGNTYMSYGLPWANASNTPFRLYKHWVHEGGIATPFIAHWPAQIAVGKTVYEPVHIVDLMATCLQAAGAAYPESSGGSDILPTEGESFLPVLRGERWSRRQPVFWEHEGNRAVRLGEWKLVSKHPGAWELYNMVEDRTEQRNLAARHRAKVRELAVLYEEWADRCNVVAWAQLIGR
jgi:arylsulfatase A-like enzyme